MVRTISGVEFSRSFALRPQNCAWLLGAGASASAGIPTGYAMITDFKKRLFCQLSNTPLRSVDANDPIWAARITALLAKQSSLPPEGDPAEYAAAFEAVYPTAENRRAYIEEAIAKGSPSFAHRVLAALLTSKKTPCVFTTNFDSLVETATTVADQIVSPAERANLTVAAIDNAARAELCLKENRWPLLVKLHGDFQSIELKNTTEELKAQDSKLREVLSSSCSRFGLVVVGYSGRDASVMAALTEGLTKPGAFPGGIYWVARSANSLIPQVKDFLMAADGAGVSIAIVESQTFDELAADIADAVDFPDALATHIRQASARPILSQVPLPSHEQRKFPILRCSALPILELPTVARRIQLESPITSERARELVREAQVYAIVASTGRELAAFGVDADLERTFKAVGGRLNGHIELRPEADSWARGLIYDALVKALCRYKPLAPLLSQRGHSLTVRGAKPDASVELHAKQKIQLTELNAAYGNSLTGTVQDLGFPFREGVQIRLELLGEQWWCAFEPFTYVELPRHVRSDEGRSDDDSPSSPFQGGYHGDPAGDWRRERWAQRYNTPWTKIISAWAKMLAGDGQHPLHAVNVEDGAGQGAAFRISPVTAWSRPSHEHDYFLRGGR